MTWWLWLVILMSWKQEFGGAIRLQDVRVPAHAAEGGSALLGCQFDMEGDRLYSVKWYKDGREFYRYVPYNRTPISHFQTPGITVDITRSSSTVVALTNLNEESAGMYRCEVSGEAPKFATVSDQKYITIHYLPRSSPTIQGLQKQYDFGERAVLNCSSAGSRPEAQLKWLVNGKPVAKENLRGPFHRISSERIDATESILELRFIVMPTHFKNGVLSIKCQAIIAPLYQEEVEHQILWDNDAYSTMTTPIEFTEENPFYPSPVFSNIKHSGFSPFDDYTSAETEDKVSKHQAKLSHAQDLLFAVLIILLIL